MKPADRLMAILEDADLNRQEYQTRLNKRVAELTTAVEANAITLKDCQHSLAMLGEIIDATENGDAVREDLMESPMVQRPLLEIHEQASLEYSALAKLLRDNS